MDEPLKDVPCDGCTLCCKGDAVRLLRGDDPSLYRTVPHWHMVGELMLEHKPNGDCFYLGEHGCTIHDHSPLMCRRMDCRNIARALALPMACKLHETGRLNIAIWRRGKELLCAQIAALP